MTRSTKQGTGKTTATHTHTHTQSDMLHSTCGPSQRGFPANPSQESLSLSGSLHSWNLETTEELSDLEEDSDQLCVSGLDDSVVEEREEEEKQEEGRLSHFQEDPRAEGITEKWEDEEEEELEKNGLSLAQEPVEDVVMKGGTEDRRLKGDDGMTDGNPATKGAEEEEEEKEEEREEAADSSVAEAELGETPQVNLASVANPMQGDRDEDVTATKATPTNNPRVLSAAARFLAPPPGPRVKTWAMEPANPGGVERPDEEVLSPVKVSELKKRFEA